MLSNSQILDYRRDGQITPPNRLNTKTISSIRSKMEQLFAARPELGTDYVPNLIEIDQTWLEFAQLPELLDVVEQLLGPDIIRGSALFCKSAIGGKATPWRQDGQYWPMRPLKTVTVWIAIDPSTIENGCLRVIPGSHATQERYAHGINNSAIN